MLNTITENRLKNNVKAFLDYVTYQKQPVLVARDDGNVVMIPQEMYEAVEEYMQMREAQELAGPRALPQAMMMPPEEQPSKSAASEEEAKEEPEESEQEKFAKPEGLADDQIDWSLFPEAAEALHKQEKKAKDDTYSFTPKQEKDKEESEPKDEKKSAKKESLAYDGSMDDDPEFAELKQQIADRVAASLKAKGIYLNDDAFNKLVDEAINEIARGNMSFLQQLDDLPNADGYNG